MNLTPGKLRGLHRMADKNGIFKMTAVDQRPPIKEPIARHLGVKEAPWDEVANFKKMLVETLQQDSTSVLLDPHFAIPGSFDVLDQAKGLIVTLEDSIFKQHEGGRTSSSIEGWSVEKIKRMGGDAVKVLAWYRPDAAPHVCSAQQDYVKRVGEQCARYDIPFLFELLVYPLPGDAHQTSEYIGMSGKNSDHVLQSVAEFAKAGYGVDVFKLECPVDTSDADGSAKTQAIFNEMGSLAGRPWVMLSAGAGKAEFRNILDHAFVAGASGFLAGRAIWLDSFRAYPDWQQIRGELETDAVSYLRDIGKLAEQKARDWRQHRCFGADGATLSPADRRFRFEYQGF